MTIKGNLFLGTHWSDAPAKKNL